MRKVKTKKEELFVVCMVIADRRRKKLLIPRETAENLHDLTCSSTEMYFKYKAKYPNYGEEIISEFKIECVDIIGHITAETTGAYLVTPDGNDIALKAQGFTPKE